MGKRSKRRGKAASIGRGQSMQVSHRMPWVPDPPALSEQAKQRLLAVEFSITHGVPLACAAHGVSRATLYRWRDRYNPYKLETLEQAALAGAEAAAQGQLDLGRRAADPGPAPDLSPLGQTQAGGHVASPGLPALRSHRWAHSGSLEALRPVD